MSQPLTDASPMPFGKWQGTPLGRVPAPYLDWMRNQPTIHHQGLRKYLEDRSEVLDWKMGKKGPMICQSGHTKEVPGWPVRIQGAKTVTVRILCDACRRKQPNILP